MICYRFMVRIYYKSSELCSDNKTIINNNRNERKEVMEGRSI